MAKVRLNPLIQGLHGKIGDLIFRRSTNGETVVYMAPEKAESKAPKEPGSPSHPFTNAHVYARSAMADPEMKAYYEQEGRRKRTSAYSLAFSSYLKTHRKLGE